MPEFGLTGQLTNFDDSVVRQVVRSERSRARAEPKTDKHDHVVFGTGDDDRRFGKNIEDDRYSRL